MLQKLPSSPIQHLPLTGLTLNIALADGARFAVPAVAGVRVMDAARAYGLPVKAECRGGCVCATCHVRIADRWRDALPEPTSEERDRLDAVPGTVEGSRLACQLVMTDDLDGLEIEMQPDSLIPQTSWVAG